MSKDLTWWKGGGARIDGADLSYSAATFAFFFFHSFCIYFDSTLVETVASEDYVKSVLSVWPMRHRRKNSKASMCIERLDERILSVEQRKLVVVVVVVA